MRLTRLCKRRKNKQFYTVRIGAGSKKILLPAINVIKEKMKKKVVIILLAAAVLFCLDVTAGEKQYQPETRPDFVTKSNLMDFTRLKQLNGDINAWVTLDDTGIDYAVLQTTNNEYYLHHNQKGEIDKYGAIFIDYRNSLNFTDFNTIIYGHNTKRGIMFAPLEKFKDKTYFDTHTSGTLYTPENTYKLEIFAVAVVPSTDAAYTWAFESITAREQFLETMEAKALFWRSEAKPTVSDRVVTFSTCSYEFENARTILLAKIISTEGNI